MVDLREEFEQTDVLGSTDEFTGTVNTFGTSLPPVAGTAIEEISIRCTVDQPFKKRLEFSFDNINWFRLKVGESREEEPRGGTITQVHIRAAGVGVTSVKYEVVMNRGQL